MNSYIRFIFLLLFLNILFPHSLFSQVRETIVIVQDENGIPVPGASVTIGEGASPVLTNEKGEFIMDTSPSTYVLVEAEGFKSKLERAVNIFSSITLTRTVFQLGEKDMIHIPFNIMPKRYLTGAVTNIDLQEILRYDHQKSLNELLNGRVAGMFGPTNLRGNGGTPLIVVDGVPRSAAELNLQQIEQITVLKDLSTTMLYGSQASHGVILITTRQGAPLRKEIRFTAETGINSPISYPKYLSAADYMELFNEARENDGLAPRYSSEQIANTRLGSNPVRYPDEQYYNNTYLNDFYPSFHFVGEASGGNEVASYYLNMGWNQEKGLLKLGEGANESTDQLNLRSNLTYDVTRNIEFRFSGMFAMNIYKAPRYTGPNFWGLTSTLHPNNSPVLIPTSLLSDELQSGTKTVNGSYLLGGTSEYQSNVYGELTSNGFRNFYRRLFQLSTGFGFDMDHIIKGLSANLNLTFDIYNQFSTRLDNTYAVYQLFYNEDDISSIAKYGNDVRRNDLTIGNVGGYYRKQLVYGSLDYERIFNNDHSFNGTALAYYDNYDLQGNQPYKNLHFGVYGSYAYKNKYLAELTGTYAFSGKLTGSNNVDAFSPAIGAGWVISEEDFLADNSLISFLKLRANVANLKTDRGLGYYQYEDWYGPSGSYNFGQGTYSNNAREIFTGNPDLGWEKITNANIGFESTWFEHRLGFDAGYFYIKSYDLISQTLNTLPAYYTANMYRNYESNQAQGIESNLYYTLTISDIKMRLGSNLTYSVPKALIVDEIDYEEDYRKLKGNETDAIFGWVAQGFFRNQAEIDNHPLQTFGVVKPGDIKYADLNNDGVIDDLDQKIIGNSSPRLGYGLHVNIAFKGLELFALANGQTGQHRIFTNAYYWVYGDRKYSEVVWDRWTPETAATASYPRLTTGSGSNNFRNSTFWLEKNHWFRLRTIQLNYTLPKLDFASISELRIYLRRDNVLQISKLKDKNELNIGSAPQTRVISFGLTAAF